MEPLQGNISRRSIAKGVAWAAPVVAVGAMAPAFAQSKSTYFECPTTLAGLTANLDADISSTAANSTYNKSSSYLTSTRQDGTTFGLSFSTGTVKTVPIYNPDGTVKRQSSGAYLIPGCGKTTCAPDVPSGFTLPTNNDVIAYDGYGRKHVGRVVSATPSGCSPVTNGGISGTWIVETDIQYNGTVCDPQSGPENHLWQISIPVSLLYLNGLDVVTTQSGGSCCLYMNFTYAPTGGCVSSQPTRTANFTYAPPAAPVAPARAPHIDNATPNYPKNGSTVKVVGGGFTGATKVTYNGVSAPFTVVNDSTITFTVPAGSGSFGTIYPIVVTTSNGTSNSFGLVHG